MHLQPYLNIFFNIPESRRVFNSDVFRQPVVLRGHILTISN